MPKRKVDKGDNENKPVLSNGNDEPSLSSSKSNGDDHDVVGYRELIRETILGYGFWSIFHALPAMIWFYPLHYMDITTYEAFVATEFTPILLIWPLKKLFDNKWVMALLRLGLIAGLGSFQLVSSNPGLEGPLPRLITLACGVGAGMMVIALSLHSHNAKQRSQTIWGLLLGFIATLVVRIWFTTYSPAWWTLFSNKVVIAIVSLATFDKIMVGDDGLGSTGTSNPETLKKEEGSFSKISWLISGAGFGSLCFLTHWVFGEVTVLTRFTVRGYPNAGPQGYPWSLAVLLFLILGLLLSSRRKFTSHPLWWFAGSLSLCGIYWLPAWYGFTCGLILATFTGSIWSETLERVSRSALVPTYLTAILVYLVEHFFLVWCVAYNFVPLGEYSREHSDYIIAAIIVTLGALFFSFRQKLSTPSYSAFIKLKDGKVWDKAKILFLLFGFIGAGGYVYRYPAATTIKTMPKPDVREFQALVWAYHFGYNNFGYPSLINASRVLEDTQADFMGIIESDSSRPFMGSNDLGQWFAERLGMYLDYGPSTKDHTWGMLLLSRYPIIESTHYLLPSPDGELAPALLAKVDVHGRNVSILCAHFGNSDDDLDRKMQGRFLSAIARETKDPLVFIGYVTSVPGSRDYKELTERGGLKDIDPTDTERFCEYIMYKNLIRLGYARVSRSHLSDTEIQMARFRIPDDLSNYKDNNDVTKESSMVLPRHKFPAIFGSWRAGHCPYPEHFYHMSTPKYFIPIESEVDTSSVKEIKTKIKDEELLSEEEIDKEEREKREAAEKSMRELRARLNAGVVKEEVDEEKKEVVEEKEKK